MLKRNVKSIKLLLCTFVLITITTGCASGLKDEPVVGEELSAGLGNVKLSWDSPTTYVDGRPLDKLSGYKIHYGTEPGDHPYIIHVTDPSASQYVIKNLPPNTYYFVITSYDANGMESAPSNEISKVVK